MTGEQETEAGHDFILMAQEIVKSYGGVHALRGVNMGIRRGKVTTLFGENGAGKSTLMKTLAGVETPTAGRIILDGEPVAFHSALDARRRGIAIIHQELSLAPNLSVRDNIFMGRELRSARGTVDYVGEERRSREILATLEEDLDPRVPVSALRLGQQQIVEIARALAFDARILIMDEPTSALSASEVRVLFKVIRDLASHGVSIVYISHHLEEALSISDLAVVLRDGSVVASGVADEIDLGWVVHHMVGDMYNPGSPPPSVEAGQPAVEISGLRVRDPRDSGRLLVDGVDLNVRPGEVVCLYGLMGAGRTELLEAIAGRLPLAGGSIRLAGIDVSTMSIAERIDRGLGLVPEDRQRDGLIRTLNVGANLSLAGLGSFTKASLVSRKGERTLIDRVTREVHVKTASPQSPIGSLSGGNQQKVVIGKVLATSPQVLLLDEPSRGIDVAAKAEIFHLVAERARRGLAVIFSTSEVNECLTVAQRIVVMRRGRIVAEFGNQATKEQIMAASGEALDV